MSGTMMHVIVMFMNFRIYSNSIVPLFSLFAILTSSIIESLLSDDRV